MVSLARYQTMDPFILCSAVNMQLRDHEFDSLEDLCSYHEINVDELKSKLKKSGFAYDENQKQFK